MIPDSASSVFGPVHVMSGFPESFSDRVTVQVKINGPSSLAVGGDESIVTVGGVTRGSNRRNESEYSTHKLDITDFD